MNISEFDIMNFLTFANIFAILLGTFVGMLIGSLPGLGIMISLVLLLPVTYMLSPLAAILLLVATYQSAEYGGSISSIILGIPGTGAAIPTVLDGNPMAKNGAPGKALNISLTASTIGGIIGGLVLIFLSIPLSTFAIKLFVPEYFLIGVLALIGVAALSTEDKLKGLISTVLGLLVGTIGLDKLSGQLRFTAGFPELLEGVSLVALVVGLFAIPEIFSMISNHLDKRYVTDNTKLNTRLSFAEWKRLIRPTAIGSFIGPIVGIIPGMGSGPSSWLAYAVAKKTSKSPETFGKGNPEGLAAPESANNATVGGSLLPLLTLGIPGSPATALIMAAFIIHGLQPGPTIFKGDPQLIYGIFFGFLLTTIAMYTVGKLLTKAFVYILTIPNYILAPTVLTLAFIGAYVSSRLMFFIWFALIIGVIFYFLKRLDFSLAAFILGFILSPIIEEAFRKSLIISYGSYAIFFTRPHSIFILLLILSIVGYALYQIFKKNKTRPQKDIPIK